MDKNFEPEDIFSRLSQTEKVRVEGVILEVETEGNIVVFRRRGKLFCTIAKSVLYERWVIIDNVLHYIRKINNWMGGASRCEYVKAEL